MIITGKKANWVNIIDMYRNIEKSMSITLPTISRHSRCISGTEILSRVSVSFNLREKPSFFTIFTKVFIPSIYPLPIGEANSNKYYNSKTGTP